MNFLIEDRRSELISKQKRGANYSPSNQLYGKNRYERRLKSRISNTVKNYNKIDMNKLFKDDILTVDIQVHGETNDYMVKFTFNGVLDRLKDEMKRSNNPDEIDIRVLSRALTRSFNDRDVYISCSCLHPDTKIKLLDGTSPTVEEMEKRFNSDEHLYVYSVDSNGDFKPGVVEKVWKTKVTSSFIKITLDNLEEILTTPEHLYMLRDGTYVQAQDISVGTSLMPLYFSETHNGYLTVKFNSTGRYHSVYKVVAEQLRQDDILEAEKRVSRDDNMPYDVAIHHMDFNKNNNTPENLKPMTAREHWEYHANCHTEISEEGRKRLSKLAKIRNANPTDAMIKSRESWQKKGTMRNYDLDRKEQQSKLMSNTMKDYYATIPKDILDERREKRVSNLKQSIKNGCLNTGKFKKAAIERGKQMHTPENEALSAEGVRKYWDSLLTEDRERRAEITRENQKKSIEKIRGIPLTEDHRRKIKNSLLSIPVERKKEINMRIQYSKILHVLKVLLENNIEMTVENYLLFKRKRDPKILTYFSSMDDAISFFKLNHKVIKVENIELPNTYVYDIKVKDYENFLVDAGVILHNCPDYYYRFSYVDTKNKINSGAPQMIPAPITNPNDDKGPGCKHVALCLTNTVWILKVASVIRNYINYMKQHYERLYADIIYPAIYDRTYEEPVQMDIFDTELSDDDIDTANKWAKTRGQWKKGNEFRFTPTKNINYKDQISFDDTIED